MISGIFRKRRDLKTSRFKLTFFDWIKSLISSILPKYCFRRRSSSLARQAGLRRIDRELDIVYFMRKQFVLNSIIKALTTKV